MPLNLIELIDSRTRGIRFDVTGELHLRGKEVRKYKSRVIKAVVMSFMTRFF